MRFPLKPLFKYHFLTVHSGRVEVKIQYCARSLKTNRGCLKKLTVNVIQNTINGISSNITHSTHWTHITHNRMTFGKKVPFIHCGEIVTFQFKLSKPSLHMFCIPELFFRCHQIGGAWENVNTYMMDKNPTNFNA